MTHLATTSSSSSSSSSARAISTCSSARCCYHTSQPRSRLNIINQSSQLTWGYFDFHPKKSNLFFIFSIYMIYFIYFYITFIILYFDAFNSQCSYYCWISNQNLIVLVFIKYKSDQFLFIFN